MKTSLFVRKVMAKKAYPKKECFPVDVITGEGEVIRYEVSLDFLKTECFKKLLEEYEEEIKWQGSGAIKLPCGVQEFENAIYKDRINSRLIKN